MVASQDSVGLEAGVPRGTVEHGGGGRTDMQLVVAERGADDVTSAAGVSAGGGGLPSGGRGARHLRARFAGGAGESQLGVSTSWVTVYGWAAVSSKVSCAVAWCLKYAAYMPCSSAPDSRSLSRVRAGSHDV
eukprot:6578177-Pyramimonas_sp.AAC.1